MCICMSFLEPHKTVSKPKLSQYTYITQFRKASEPLDFTFSVVREQSRNITPQKLPLPFTVGRICRKRLADVEGLDPA